MLLLSVRLRGPRRAQRLVGSLRIRGIENDRSPVVSDRSSGKLPADNHVLSDKRREVTVEPPHVDFANFRLRLGVIHALRITVYANGLR